MPGRCDFKSADPAEQGCFSCYFERPRQSLLGAEIAAPGSGSELSDEAKGRSDVRFENACYRKSGIREFFRSSRFDA